ncbi:MAG: serine hydrolase domain-containing protein, partial [Sideroxyarcus sp.]|nr:serine hydrolase domain-containing protein [Sideroxyarcus sp.]
ITAQAKLFDFLPGTAWLYSNANYIVLGAIIEQLTGMSLSAAADVMLFKPLGLANTAFDSAAAVVRGRASGYTPVEGDTGRYTHAAFLEIDEAGGAGAMRSTTADLCQWSAALHGNQLFDARYVEEMRSPGRLRDGRLSAQRRFSANDAGYGDTSYAMGLLISGPSAPVPSLMHYGAINGYAAFLEYFPVHDLTVAVLCNGDMAPAMPFREIRKAIRSNIEQFRIV